MVGKVDDGLAVGMVCDSGDREGRDGLHVDTEYGYLVGRLDGLFEGLAIAVGVPVGILGAVICAEVGELVRADDDEAKDGARVEGGDEDEGMRVGA